MDFIIFWPILFFLVKGILGLPNLEFLSLFLYLALVLNGLILAAVFHILVLATAITTYEVDNALMIYRDLSSLGRVPVDLYREPIRFLMTFVIPIGIMVTFPVKALMGLISWPFVLISFLVSALFLYLCLKFWNRSLKQYSSASS